MTEGQPALDPGPVLITGANGQLGRRLIERLATSSPRVDVRAVVRSERAAATLRALPESIQPRLSILDYGDQAQLTAAAEGCATAVHLVGILKEGKNSRYVDAHENATRTLIAAAEAVGLSRIVYLSILETSPDSPNDCLRSKGIAEQMLLDSKVPAVILKVPMVLGPGDFTTRIVRGEALARLLPIVGGGRNRSQPIFAADVVEAVFAALTRAGLSDVSFDLAGPESLPQRELIARAAALYGKSPTVIAIPRWVGMVAARLAGALLPNPPLTPTSLDVILADDDVDPKPACDRLGIELTPLDEILRRCVGPEAPTA